MDQGLSRHPGSWRPSAGLRAFPSPKRFSPKAMMLGDVTEDLGLGRSRFANRRKAIGVFQMLVRFFLYVFRKQSDSVGIFQNIHLDALLAKYFLRAGKICNITDDTALKLAPVDQRRTNVTSAESRKDRGLAEIHASRISCGRRLAMIVRMVLLDQCIVSFANDFPCLVVYDYAAYGAAAFVVSLSRQQDADSHEVSVR